MPINVDNLVLYGGIVPLSKDELQEVVDNTEGDLGSPLIPTLAMKLWFARGVLQNWFPMDFLPLEQETDKVGFGHLPLIEAVGSMEPRIPSNNDLENQLCLFLRSITGTNNLNLQRFRSSILPKNFPSSVTGQVNFQWPAFRGALEEGSVALEVQTTGL